MATYNPPTENLAIFDPSVFTTADIPLTSAEADKRYLKFPNAQGTENLATTNINGLLTTNGDVIFASLNPPTSNATQPASNDSSTKMPTTAWIQGAISGSSLLPLNNTWTGTNDFSNNVSIGSAGTSNLSPTLTTYKTNLILGTGGQGQLDVECPINVGGFGSINLLNADIQMTDDSIINQLGTRTIPNVLYSTNILNGSHIQYNSDNTQQTSAFTGAGSSAGSYTSTNMTLDSNGKITAISNGTSNGDADMLYLTNTSGCLDASKIVGTNWDITTTFQPSGVRAIQTNSTGQYVAVAQNSVGYSLSTDYGQTFTTNAGVYASERTRGVAFSASGRYFLVQTGNGFNGNLYWSPNYGASFTGLIGGGITSSADVCIDTTCIDADGTRFYTFNLLASAPTLYRFVLTGAGAITTATTTTFGGSTSFSVVSALKCSADGKYVIFNGQTGGINYIYYSSDYGATFTRISTPANTTLGGGGQTVAMSKTGEIMVGVCRNTSTGNTVVFVSNNYGANWFSAGNILVNASVGFIFDRIAMNGDGNIIIASAVDTAGIDYFYATSNLGFSWFQATGANAGERFTAISNDGSLIYSQRPTPANDFVSTTFPLHTVNTTNLQTQQIIVSVPSYFEDFYFANSASTIFGEILPFTQTGIGGSANIFGGAYDATIQTVAERRLGMVNMNSGNLNGEECILEADDSFRFPMLGSVAFGFIPLGASDFTTTVGRTDQLQVIYGMGVINNPSGSFSQTGVYWRNTTTTSVVSWSLVEDNVIQETLSGTNLTGQLTGKWCRCSITFYNNGANFYGEFWNLTDSAYYRTANYATNAPNAQTNLAIAINCGTTNATVKRLGLDYCALECNTLPLGGSTTAFR